MVHGKCMHAHQALITDWAQALSTLSSSQLPPVPLAADSAQQMWMDLEGSQCFSLFPLSNFRNPHLYYPIPLHSID